MYHASVVRRIGEKRFEYLELQDIKEKNKWKELDGTTLEKRFGRCRNREKRYLSCLIDIELYINDLGFRRLLGYLNTQK